MFPTSKEWTSWRTFDKVAYVAQLAAALSLLPTTVFAFLGWREARLARVGQAELFIAENAPNVVVEAITLTQHYLVVSIRNNGASHASRLTVDLDLHLPNGESTRLRKELLSRHFGIFRIKRDETVHVNSWSSNAFNVLGPGYRPKAVVEYDVLSGAGIGNYRLHVNLGYQDVVGNKYSGQGFFELVK